MRERQSGASRVCANMERPSSFDAITAGSCLSNLCPCQNSVHFLRSQATAQDDLGRITHQFVRFNDPTIFPHRAIRYHASTGDKIRAHPIGGCQL
jgi:hypothetical protein